MTWPFGHLSRNGYGVITTDPPWAFKHRSRKGFKKSAEGKYATQSLDWISALPVAELAERDCFLFLWATAPGLDQALAAMRAWGFAYKSRMSWRKVFASGKPAIGPGYIVRTMHEDVLIGTRGKPRLAKALPSIFDGIRREHSRKPEEFYQLVEAVTPDVRRCDLFTRSRRMGWVGWGDEADLFDGIAA